MRYDEATGHTHPATSGILYVSLERLAHENTPAGELAAILLGKEKSTTDKDVDTVIQALNASFENFKDDKEVAFVYSLKERWTNDGRIECIEDGIAKGKAEGKAEGINLLAELLRNGLSLDEALRITNENNNAALVEV